MRVGCARLESYCGGGCESEAGCCEEAEEEVGGEHFGETDCCLVGLLWFGFVSLVLCVFVNLGVVQVVKL